MYVAVNPSTSFLRNILEYSYVRIYTIVCYWHTWRCRTLGNGKKPTAIVICFHVSAASNWRKIGWIPFWDQWMCSIFIPLCLFDLCCLCPLQEYLHKSALNWLSWFIYILVPSISGVSLVCVECKHFVFRFLLLFRLSVVSPYLFHASVVYFVTAGIGRQTGNR